MGGVEFEGTVDPTVAEKWFERIERVFEQLECSDTAKFKYAVSLLQKYSYDWWVSVPNAREKPPVLTWNDFVKEFNKKYVPPAYHDVNKKEFLNLEQGSMSITEYQQKFLRLSHYAGVLAALTWERIDKEQVGRNEHKFRKAYVDSRGPSKRGRFDSSKANTFRKLSQHKQNRSSSFTASTPSYGQGKTRIPTCAQCGKNHFGTCRRASGACFNYGSFDYKVRDCPNPNPTSSPHTEGSVQKPVTIPSQGNKGARLLHPILWYLKTLFKLLKFLGRILSYI
ncbi:uncharacterized protein LOC129870912 [Solanum dulcamara]|uniref:uncharacterized protein LOC129870912 n=1 Tax=Solanum dulcamara TaxID=45834 RepID=UPI002485A7FA|nr:uncharacterized protein LOC129870912 [Solanum dulcamara]